MKDTREDVRWKIFDGYVEKFDEYDLVRYEVLSITREMFDGEIFDGNDLVRVAQGVSIDEQ